MDQLILVVLGNCIHQSEMNKAIEAPWLLWFRTLAVCRDIDLPAQGLHIHLCSGTCIISAHCELGGSYCD